MLELGSCVKVEVGVLDFPSLIVLMVPVDVKQHLKMKSGARAQDLCDGRGGRPGLPAPNSPHGHCGRQATVEEEVGSRQSSGAV